MARYLCHINTDAYKLAPCSKETWEPGTRNDFMVAINGWHCVENSLREVENRIDFFAGHYVKDDKWRNKRKNRIRFRDQLCGFDRTYDVALPGFPQGYICVDDKVNELKKNGTVVIEFSEGYDVRQASYKRMKGCYLEITRLD